MTSLTRRIIGTSKRITPPRLHTMMRDYSDRFDIGTLPEHAYPAQFDAEMDCPPREWAERFILIASTPRCGSHYLGHMLGSTGECGVPLEYLNQSNKRYWARRFKQMSLGNLFPHFVKNRTSPNGTFTVKTHWDQFQPFLDQQDRLTKGVGFNKVIWISRRNLLSQAISTVIAKQTGVWIHGATPKAEARYNYDAIVNSAKNVLRSNLAWRDFVATLPQERQMRVVYEDLLSDQSTCDALREFLEIDAVLAPSTRTKRQSNELNMQWKNRFELEVLDADAWILEPPAWLS